VAAAAAPLGADWPASVGSVCEQICALLASAMAAGRRTFEPRGAPQLSQLSPASRKGAAQARGDWRQALAQVAIEWPICARFAGLPFRRSPSMGGGRV